MTKEQYDKLGGGQLLVPTKLLDKKDLYMTDKIVLSSLFRYSLEYGVCIARNEDIRDSVRIDQSVLSKSLQRLKKADYIKVNGSTKDRTISITTDIFETLLDKDADE